MDLFSRIFLRVNLFLEMKMQATAFDASGNGSLTQVQTQAARAEQSLRNDSELDSERTFVG